MQVSIGNQAGQWVAYVILFTLAVVYLAFFLMLICKIVEAFIRIFGGVGFDRSRHAVDSGLMGVLGLLGCCSTRRRQPQRGDRRSRPLSGALNASQSSFSFSHPANKKGPNSSPSGPPSVLRPEHALRPYREETDDENGFIMGAWQPFPRPGYNALQDGPSRPSEPSPPAKSGFSRVAGGRAHYESPYAIASRSSLTFPSVERNHTPTRASVDSIPFPSEMDVERHLHSDLPPGAMMPHARKKSQTAIIEEPQAFTKASFANQQVTLGSTPLRNFTTPDMGEQVTDDDSDFNQPKKRHWYQLRRQRRYSDGESIGRENESKPERKDKPGQSFVVVRKRKPSQPLASGSALPPAEPAESQDRTKKSSFVVIRGKNGPQS